MIQSAALLKDLKAQLKLVQADLRARADDKADRWGARLQEEYAEARRRERTGHSWVVWRDNEVDQAAVAWLIATTFVRFCEDNDLLDGRPDQRGHGSGRLDRRVRATGRHGRRRTSRRTSGRTPRTTVATGSARPSRCWLRSPRARRSSTRRTIRSGPLTSAPSALTALVDFWRATDASGELVHDFTDPALDTRFLGDLYQDLSEHARKTYALLQTPVFVEEFILDQTLTPALAEFGLDGHQADRPDLRLRPLPARRLRAAGRPVGRQRRRRSTPRSAYAGRWTPSTASTSTRSPSRSPASGSPSPACCAMGERSLVEVPDLGFHLAVGDSLLGESAVRQRRSSSTGRGGRDATSTTPRTSRSTPASSSPASTTSSSATRPTSRSRTRRSTRCTAQSYTTARRQVRALGAVHGAASSGSPSRASKARARATSGRSPPTRS